MGQGQFWMCPSEEILCIVKGATETRAALMFMVMSQNQQEELEDKMDCPQFQLVNGFWPNRGATLLPKLQGMSLSPPQIIR